MEDDLKDAKKEQFNLKQFFLNLYAILKNSTGQLLPDQHNNQKQAEQSHTRDFL